MTRFNTLLVAALLAATSLATAAYAQDSTTTTTYHSETYYNWNPLSSETQGLYLSGQAGGTMPTDDYDDDGVYSVALGWQFHPMLRTEIEGAYRNTDLDGVAGDQDTWTWMLNGYWDIKNDSAITPYLGAGVGYAHATLDTAGNSDHEGAFVWQAIAGAAFELTPNWALTADYRYIDTTDFDFAAGDADFSSHEVRGGLRYTF